jgi:protein-S-isoprenylcysteine O-methyltransferase Ste14
VTWSRIARRIRVPLGFVFAAIFLWLARPTLLFLAVSLILVAPGVWLRAYASGYVKKNAELTTTGPYAHTRNPLYLGSILIGVGFAVASRSVWVFAVLVALFVAIYWPVIRSEEAYLRSVFAGFDAYAARVPRLIPRIVPKAERASTGGAFSWTLYRKHREYNAAMGAGAMYAALILKLILLYR